MTRPWVNVGACKLDGCERPARTRGLCATHYTRLLVHGSVDGGTHRDRTDLVTIPAFITSLGGRVTFRMLDHWERCGWMRLENAGQGSGRYRYLNAAEIAALTDLVAEYERVQSDLAEIKSGRYFAAALARHSTEVAA